MTTRRQMLKTLGIALLAAHRTSNAQPPSKAVRIGYLGATSANQYTRQVAALREGLRELGYVEGKNYSIEFRWADNQYDLLPRLAAELVGLKVDLIVTSGPATIAAKNATSTLPIVAAVMGDPLATLRTGQSRPTSFPMTLATNPLRAAGLSKRARMRFRTAPSTPALAAAVKVWE